MSFDSLKGKKIHGIELSTHIYHHTITGIDITFQDGTILHVSARGHGDIRTDIKKGDIPQEKKLPWRKNEKKFLATLPDIDKEEYLQARKAFFWLLENKKKVEECYSWFDENWREARTSFSMQIDMDKNDPEGILTIFFSSHVAPECDDWFVLSKKRDWKRILEMQNEVFNNGKPKS